MFAVLLILIAALAMAVVFNRKLHETLAPALFMVTLTVYVLGLVMSLNTAIGVTVAIVICLVIIGVGRATNHLRKRRLRSFPRVTLLDS